MPGNGKIKFKFKLPKPEKEFDENAQEGDPDADASEELEAPPAKKFIFKSSLQFKEKVRKRGKRDVSPKLITDSIAMFIKNSMTGGPGAAKINLAALKT